MGVIKETPGRAPRTDDEGNYIFSSKPGTPGERGGELLVKFQAVGSTQPCLAQEHITVPSHAKLFRVRRQINKYFKNKYEKGFIFLSKTKEILKSDEKRICVFDILPKVPRIASHNKPSDHFLFPDVHYEKVFHNYDGARYSVTCACVVFLFERSAVSHWPKSTLCYELGGDVLEGFSFIPTDIMSWPQRLVESRVTNVHIKAAQSPRPGLKGKKKEEYDKRTKDELERAIQQIPPRTKIHDLCDHRLATPLHYAASNGNLALCEVIIAGMGKDQLFSVDAGRRTPLHCALYRSSKKLDTVIYLLQQSSNLSLCDIHGLSPLAMLQSLQTKSLNYISDKLEFDCASKELQVFFLQFALRRRKEKLALTLTEHLGDISHIEMEGESFLHQSAILSSKITDNMLRHCHLNPVVKDITGRLPFHVACKSGNAEQVTLLYDNAISDDQIRLGLKIALRYKKFDLCPHVLSFRPELIMDEEIICTVRSILNQMLDKHRRTNGSRIKLKDWEETAKQLLPLLATEKNAVNIYMFDCAYYGMYSTLEYLLEKGIDVDICDYMGRTPLHEASQQNNIRCVEVLLKHNASLDAVDQRRSTALHYACEKGHLNVVKCLTEAGANLRAQDVCGRTCFMLSIYRNRIEVSNFLVKKHASKLGLSMCDKTGQNTLSYSALLPEETLEMLLEGMAHTEDAKEATEVSEDEISKRRDKEQTHEISWIWNMHDTSFKATFPERLYDDNWNVRSEKQRSFTGTCRFSLWRDQKVKRKIFSNSKIPSIQYDVCNSCQRIRFQSKHKCSRTASRKNIEESYQKILFKPFEFHNLGKVTPLSPSHVAIRDRKIVNMKKLSKFQPELLKSKDSLGRNLINFAIDQGSLKLVKAVFETDKNSVQEGLVHDLFIRNIISPESEDDAILEFILSLGYDAEFIPEPEALKHSRCGYHLDVKQTCLLHCHLRSYTPLEVAIRNGNYEHFKLILSHMNSPNLGLGLHFVSFFGNNKFIDVLHRVRKKLRQKQQPDAEEEENIQEWLKLDSLYALNLACSSPHIDLESMKSLLQYHPEAMKTENCMNINDLEEIRKYIKFDIDTSSIPQMTPLAKLLSPKHPNKLKRFVDDIGCHLIDSGLNLGIYKYDDGEINVKLHCACESLYAALLSGHYKSALNILKKAGNIIWRCAFSEQRCSAQTSFQKRMFHWQREEYFTPSYIKYVLFLSSRREVPEIVLKALIAEGEHFRESNTTDYVLDVSEVREENRENAANLANPIHKLLLCVLEIMELEKKCGDFLKLLKYAPAIYPFICGIQERLLEKTDIEKKEKIFFKAMAIYMGLSELPDHNKPPENSSLLHVACCTDKKEFVKMIAEAPASPDVMAKTSNKLRAIDIASAFGHWTVVQYLLERNASFSCETLLACTAKERYMEIGIWARHLVFITESETASEKSRTKIFKELCKQKDLDLTYSTSENGSILLNAMKHQLHDIVDFILEKNQAVLMKALNEEEQIVKYIPKCKSKTLKNIIGIVERNITKVSPSHLGKLLLSLSRQHNHEDLNYLTAAMKRSVSYDIMQDILLETDEHGRTVLHFIALYGYKSACKTLVKCTRSNRNGIELEYKNIIDLKDFSKTPALWYAMANGHWEVANILLLAGASPKFIRSVPDFRPRRHTKLHNQKTDNRVKTSVPYECGFDIPMRKTFPLLVNTSFSVGPCINPGVKMFEKRTALNESASNAQGENSESHNVKTGTMNTKVKQETQHLFDIAMVAFHNQTTILHVVCNSGNEPLLRKIKEYFGTGQHFFDYFEFNPYMHSILSGNKDTLEILQTDNFKIDNIEFWRAFIWKYSRNDVPIKFLEISLFSMIEMILRKSEMTEQKQSLLNQIVKHQARKRHAPILEDSQFTNDVLRNVIRIMHEDKNYSLDEEQVQTFIALHKYIRETGAKEKVTPLYFLIENQENHKVPPEHLKSLTTNLLIQNAEKLEKQIILLLIFTGRQWCIDALLDAAEQSEHLRTVLSSSIFGPFSFLDCCLLAMSNGRKKVSDMSLTKITERALTSLGNTLDKEVIAHAVSERLWDALKPIAIKTLAQKGELAFCWHRALASAVSSGNLDFVQSLLNLISLSRLSDHEKSFFGAHLCLASLGGQTEIVRSFLRAGAPISIDTESEEVRNLIGKKVHDSWSVIHYAVKSNIASTFETVAKFCRFDKDFMSSLQYDSLFRLVASSTGNTLILSFLKRLFIEKGLQPSRTEWEGYALEAAKNGFEELCSYLVEHEGIDLMCVDSRHRNLLHYCALRDMDKLLLNIIKNASAAAETKDLDGFYPYEYAFYLGNQHTAKLFQMNSAWTKGFRMPGSQHVYGWLRHLLETNGKTATEKSQISSAFSWNSSINDKLRGSNINHYFSSRAVYHINLFRRHCDRNMSLENVIKKYNDQTTVFILILSTNSLREAMIERPNEYSHLFHLTAGYGHKKSLTFLCELLQQNKVVLRKYLQMERDGAIPLTCAVKNMHKDCIDILMQLDSYEDWKSTRTGENVLHFACKTGRIDIVQKVLNYTNRNMLLQRDNNESTPITASLALGHHTLLSELDFNEISLKSDCTHNTENVDFNCPCCLLNESIGWSNIYQTNIDFTWKALRPVSLSLESKLKSCSKLERFFDRCGLHSTVVKAVMISMGYEATASNTLLRLALQPFVKPRTGKLMTHAEFSQIVENLPVSLYDTLTMFSWSIQYDKESLFELISNDLSKLLPDFEKHAGISCYEAILGLGSYKCLKILQKLLDIEQEEFSFFREIQDNLPVHVKWLARLEVPGDEEWCNRFANHTSANTSERLSSADIWLTSRLPNSIKIEMETMYGDRSWIPTVINGKKFSADIESFKKHKSLSGKSHQWISCLIGSGTVAGTLHFATEQVTPKVQAANSVKVSCIQSGSNDHAKVNVDGSGCIQASVELLSDKGALFVIDDRSLHQKFIETELKEKIQQDLLPTTKKFIQENFNLGVTIKVDWQSIEIRKRNWNAEMVLKTLTGDIFDNQLGGFGDVIKECLEMKLDIEDMFNAETVDIAMGTALDLKEITIAFDDKKPSTNELMSQKTHLLRDKCTWNFTIENNCLLYNRESFPLWRNLFFYRGICASLCSAVHSISVIHPNISDEANRSSKRSSPTLEVEWRSFGLKDLYAVRSLITKPIARELQGISYDCAGMLRLCQESKRILIKNSPSHQHSGITFQSQTAVIAVYPSQDSKREWQVERTNAGTRLAEYEDRQMQSKWDSSNLSNVRQHIGNIEKYIEDKTGLKVKISVDEKRFLLTAFCKLRREMTDPNILISKATEKVVDSIKDIYIKKIEDLIQSTHFVVCVKENGFNSNAGAWVRSQSSVEDPGLLLEVIGYKLDAETKNFKYGSILLPWILKHLDYKITPDTGKKVKPTPTLFTRVNGLWKSQTLAEAGKNTKFITYKDQLYEVKDQRDFETHIGKFLSRITIAQEVLDVFESKGNVSLETKICSMETKFNTKRVAALQIKSDLKERLLKLLPVNEINFDEESFLVDPNGLIQLSQCGECTLDTVYKVMRPNISPICSVELQRSKILFEMLSKVKVLKFMQIQDSDDGTQNATDRIVFCLESKVLAKIVLHRKRKITIVFSKLPSRETFVDEFQCALIHLEEILIEEILPCKSPQKQLSRASSGVSSSARRRFIDINHVTRPNYKTALDLFFIICSVFKRLNEAIPAISDIASSKVRNVCLSSVDGDKLRAGLVGETLVIHVPPVCVSRHEFPSMLLSSLGLSEDMKEVSIPTFRLLSHRLFYPERNGGEVELSFYNLVDGINHKMNLHQNTIEKDFTVFIINEDKKDNFSEASVQNVEVTSEQHVKVSWISKESTIGMNDSIKLLFKGREIECARGLLLPTHLYPTKIKQTGERKGSLHVDRGGFFPVLLCHSNCSLGNKCGSMTAHHRRQIVRKRCVEFSIDTRGKPFPNSNITWNPVEIQQYPSGRTTFEKYWKNEHVDGLMRYKIKILDSCRSVVLTAKCLCCQHQLAMATPAWYLEPGEKLYINPHEEL